MLYLYLIYSTHNTCLLKHNHVISCNPIQIKMFLQIYSHAWVSIRKPAIWHGSPSNRIFYVKHQIGKFSILNLVILFSYWQKNSIYLLYNTDLLWIELFCFGRMGWDSQKQKAVTCRIKKMTRAPTKRRIFAHLAHFSHFKE